MKNVSKTQLKEQVDAIVEKNLNVVVAAGVRTVMNNKTGKKETLEFEFVQARQLEGSNVNLLAALNKGDDRFRSNVAKLRVWTSVTPQGATETLGISEENVKSLIEACDKLGEDERIALMMPVTSLNINGKNVPLKVTVKEETDIEKLPNRVKNQLDGEYAGRYIAQRYVKDENGDQVLENLVDEAGNTVYRWTELTPENVSDVIVPNKRTVSEYEGAETTTANIFGGTSLAS